MGFWVFVSLPYRVSPRPFKRRARGVDLHLYFVLWHTFRRGPSGLPLGRKYFTLPDRRYWFVSIPGFFGLHGGHRGSISGPLWRSFSAPSLPSTIAGIR